MNSNSHHTTGQLLNESLKHHQAGRLGEAAAGYQKILQENPQHCDALHLLGVVAQQMDKLDMAIELMKAAIAQNPSVAHYHHNLGNTYLKSGQPKKALECYRQAILLKQDYFEAHHGLGNALAELDEWELAAQAYQHSINIQPSFAEAHYNLGRALSKLNSIEQARSCYHNAISLDNTRHEFFFNLGGLLLKVEDYPGAIAAYKNALVLHPEDPDTLSNLGLAYAGIADHGNAVNSYIKAIQIKPAYASAHSNLAIALLKNGNLFEAEQACLQALAIDPQFAEAQYNLGNILREQGRLSEAIESYRKAINLSAKEIALGKVPRSEEIKSVHWQASNNLACTLDEQGETTAALACHQEALSLYPQNPVIHWNLSLILLMHGNFVEGWKEYEWRWHRKDFPTKLRDFACPLWTGQSLKGERILLHAEQGFGDTLQFVRYAALVAECGGEVILEVQPALRRLLENVAGVSRIVSQGEPLPEFSWHCPLMSLPFAFRTTLESIPSFPSYLSIPENEVIQTKQKWAAPGFRLGLAWAGNPKHINDHHRSMHLQDFIPLANTPGVTFYSLQVGEASKQILDVGLRFPIYDVCSQNTDFAQTATFIAGLDLVITVDTAVAHLAGALGIPVWILLAHSRTDWRWLRNREDSPWYPSAQLLRQQTPGDWTEPISIIKENLRQLVRSTSR